MQFCDDLLSHPDIPEDVRSVFTSEGARGGPHYGSVLRAIFHVMLWRRRFSGRLPYVRLCLLVLCLLYTGNGREVVYTYISIVPTIPGVGKEKRGRIHL